MLVAQILQVKGAQVFSCGPDETLAAAARALMAHRVGAIVIMSDEERVVGILSERDIVGAIAGHGAAALDSAVSGHMTKDVIFARPQETVDELLARMTDRRFRHMPVCEEERLLGLVSIGDLVKAKIAETTHEAETLKAYIVSG